MFPQIRKLPLTKPLAKGKFYMLRERLGLVENTFPALIYRFIKKERLCFLASYLRGSNHFGNYRGLVIP
uniref:Uncharacterized protein n=1 Tax=Picea glauca TaxID=3330 RepID=A0A117NH13_PICGL|nr:hypothetical protein ABT39_MTgene5788 [Picea glauca]QHR90436.1 hypothetical protein Q903MT_gene4460 [Picea sitchensis]